MESRKKYLVFYWDKDEILSYCQDYSSNGEESENEFYFAIESNKRSVMDYGQQIGESNNEDEALRLASDYLDSHHLPFGSAEIFVWDSENRYWFN